VIRHFAIHAMHGYLKLTDKHASDIKYPDRMLSGARK